MLYFSAKGFAFGNVSFCVRNIQINRFTKELLKSWWRKHGE